MRAQDGFTLVELLIASTIALLVLLAVMGLYLQAGMLDATVRSNVKVHGNIRLGMDQLERDLRMIGFRVPRGKRVDGSEFWTPVVFHASATALGFRAEIDGGNAEITCTPAVPNPNCPRSKLRLDSVAYYAALNCNSPGGGSLALNAVLDGEKWEPTTCSAVDGPDSSITVADVKNMRFTGGRSEAVTIEQVYYRFVPGAQPTYGYLERYVRYGNMPDDTFPPASASWTVVARQLTDFWIEYQDESGTTLTGNPLSSAEKYDVRRVVLFMEGYDEVGVDRRVQLIQTRSEVLVRNLKS